MAKYISAERLKEEIKRQADSYQDTYTDNMRDNLLSFIDYLQQEQPDCHTVEDWIGYIKNADQLTKDIFSKGPYDVLWDALNHPYQHCYDAIKEFGELCFQTGVNSVKQEQPSLPDNLDEAAKNHARTKYGLTRLLGAEMREVEDDFKAGAQWMKEQLTMK